MWIGMGMGMGDGDGDLYRDGDGDSAGTEMETGAAALVRDEQWTKCSDYLLIPKFGGEWDINFTYSLGTGPF